MPGISAFIICCNEADAIEECLKSVSWMDEIVVVDSGSTDDTVAICRRYTDQVHHVPWQGYGRQKALALERTTGDWVFSIDADERVTEELKTSILAAVGSPGPCAGYRVARRNYFLGRWLRHGGWYPDRQLRLFQRALGRFEERPVHEKVLLDGPVGDLEGDLLHYTYDSLDEYITRQHRYQALTAQIRHDEGRRVSLPGLVWGPIGRFLEVYLYKGGFRDGPEGLVVSLLTACFHVVRCAKMWEMQRAPRRPTR